MIVILVSKINGVTVAMSFLDTAGKAGDIVCPFVEVSIIQIVFFLKDVLLYALEVQERPKWAKRQSYRWHSDRQIDIQSPFHRYSCLACITAHNIDVCWLRVGQCVLCVLCRPGLRERNANVMGVKLFAFRLKNLCKSQTFDGLDGEKCKSTHRFCFTIRNLLYDDFEPAKRILHLDHAPFVIRSQLCKELVSFQLQDIFAVCTPTPYSCGVHSCFNGGVTAWNGSISIFLDHFALHIGGSFEQIDSCILCVGCIGIA